MAGRGPQTFQKRQKEQQRKEKQEEKRARRMQKKNRPAADGDQTGESGLANEQDSESVLISPSSDIE